MSTLRGLFRLACVGRTFFKYKKKILNAPEDQRQAAFHEMIDHLHKVFNIKVNVVGTPLGNTGRRTLYAINHVSNLDALIVNGPIENASNIADSGVADWQLLRIGEFAKSLGTVFVQHVGSKISDEEKAKIVQQTCDAAQAPFDQGNNLILFPEGTMSNGTKLLKFRPAIFSLAYRPGNEDLAVQPVALEVASVNGQPVPKGVPSKLRERYARYTEVTQGADGKKIYTDNKSMFALIWDMATNADITFNMTFLPELDRTAYADHTEMAQAARAAIGKTMQIEEFRPAA
ncbi:MAG TPA: lysophospholipid acyltransferase family protein [Alphaproteobacteria bacterium]|nr:lysophospholipid acyltransferase family protein [Alphaproteobacteria bacterium]